MAFSDTWLKANNGKERGALEERGDRGGLGVRITPKGRITFQLRYRYQGAAKRLDLGSYPLMSLKDIGADLNLTHRADPILTRGWMPTA